MSAEDTYSKISDVLRNHFGNASEDALKAAALDINSDFGVWSSIEFMERSDTDPAKDIELINKSISYLKKAQDALSKVGWYGCKAMEPIAKAEIKKEIGHSFREEMDDGSFVWPVDGRSSRATTINLINELEKKLTEAKNQIDPNAPSLWTALDEGAERQKRVKPKETVACDIAKACGKQFYELTGQRPTVSTNPYKTGRPAYGPFLDFVNDIFSALEISASAEVWAKNACKELSRKNS